MKTLLASVLAVAAGGCFVVPSTATSRRDLGTVTAGVRRGASRSLALSTEVDRGEVTVRAIRRRDCLHDVYRVTEITETKSLRLGGVDDPRGRVFGAVLAPVTLPVSFLISGLMVATDREGTRQERTLDHVTTSSCTEPAGGLLVTVELASGLRFERVTDDTGAISFRLPETEPYRGTIVARAETQSVELKYKRRDPSELAVRAAVTSCAEQHGVTGTLDVRIAVNERGLPTKVELDHGEAPFTACITTRVARVQFRAEQASTTVVVPVRLGS